MDLCFGPANGAHHIEQPSAGGSTGVDVLIEDPGVDSQQHPFMI